jgi:hypothetical protein
MGVNPGRIFSAPSSMRQRKPTYLSFRPQTALFRNFLISYNLRKMTYFWIGNYLKGSRKNKFAILGVEAPAWQGAKTQEYLDIPSFRNAARRDASASKM